MSLNALYRACRAKINIHEDETTVSGVTEGGEEHRIIFVNRAQPTKFVSNNVTTAKYNAVSFVPLFLFEQFRRYSNCFFLMIALLQQIPDVSPTGRWTTLLPLLFILSVSAVKEILEDWKRHRADDETNRRQVEVVGREGTWQRVRWDQLRVGDLARVYNNNFFPADLLLLATSEPQGMSFIETSNLDGETNLKVRQALGETSALTSAATLHHLYATVHCDAPNRNLYTFRGTLKCTNQRAVPLGLEQVLLRGAMLRNTRWVHALVLYTGHDTKLMRNSTKAPLKRSSIDRQTNTHILLLFGVLLALCVLCAGCSELWARNHSGRDWYIGLSESANVQFGFSFLTFLILYNNLIPISLQVTAEIVRYFQAKFIALDQEMYDERTNTPAQARTSNLNEELGMIKYVFSDKTGTLTCNVMEFKMCSIAEKLYHARGEERSWEDTPLVQDILLGHPNHEVLREFLSLLAVCHTVIPERSGDDIVYHAASPDERALVMGAAQLGWVFSGRSGSAGGGGGGGGGAPSTTVTVQALGSTLHYQLLHVLDFTSARKRMSVVVRTPAGHLKLYCKGADNVVYERLGNSRAQRQYAAATLAHLEDFAAEGLRTLVLADADISPEFYKEWSRQFHEASVSMGDREAQLERVAELIETDLRLLGATAIEDKLQEGVGETIARLLQANIHVWMLTGDKVETAINIAHASRLVTANMPLLLLTDDTLDGTRATIARNLAALGEGVRTDNAVALVVGGQTLTYAMGCELKKDFLDLCISCRSVICCRVSPIQKAEVVEMVGVATGAVTLAVGDGANDVAMIQRASVGVGISGVEGLQAVCASDYSIAQFRFLLRLLLVHGAWNYSRISKLILYSFYKNICLYVIELWFAIYSAWSGQIVFERWSIGFYNVAFTAMPPFAIGLFEKVCSADIMLRHPVLYLPSQLGLLFNVRVFWVWVVNSLLHSVLLFWLPMLMVEHDTLWPSSSGGGYLLLGNIVYTYVVLTVCLKAGLVTFSWTWVTHIALWGSLALWVLFLLLYSNVYPALSVGAVMSGMDRIMFSTPVFWLGLALIPLATLIPDLVAVVMHNTLWKSVTEAVRESEIKKRDPDHLLSSHHRHSVSETARLLKNVRSVFARRAAHAQPHQELELAHGFAFSQEEGGSVSQADVIRAYDMTRSPPAPAL